MNSDGISVQVRVNHRAAVVFLLFFIGLGGFAVTGCASKSEPALGAKADLRPHAECLVCKRNADLACVNLRVDAATPHADYQGRTYYFCSDSCRVEFLKNPAKYASH